MLPELLSESDNLLLSNFDFGEVLVAKYTFDFGEVSVARLPDFNNFEEADSRKELLELFLSSDLKILLS